MSKQCLKISLPFFLCNPSTQNDILKIVIDWECTDDKILVGERSAMKLPEIQSMRKLRDMKIITLFSRQHKHPLQIASQVNISVSQVYRILQKHSGAINHDIQHKKNMRITLLERMLKFYPCTIGNKTTLDIIKEHRAELEGEKGIEINNNNQQYTIMPSITLKDGTDKEYEFGTRIRNATKDINNSRETISDS